MKNILVVDDSAFMRMSLKKILDKHDYVVIGEAGNGRDAVEKYKELSPDLVTLDITMKELDGLGALKEIMKIDDRANVLMVSAMGQDSIITEATEAGAKGFLTKPFRMESVIATISRLFP